MKRDRLKNQPGHGFETSPDFRTALKQSLLLATAIFLMSAPTPDSKDIAGISANLIAPVSDLSIREYQTGE